MKKKKKGGKATLGESREHTACTAKVDVVVWHTVPGPCPGQVQSIPVNFPQACMGLFV